MNIANAWCSRAGVKQKTVKCDKHQPKAEENKGDDAEVVEETPREPKTHLGLVARVRFGVSVF